MHITILLFCLHFIKVILSENSLFTLNVGESICPGQNFVCGDNNDLPSFLCSEQPIKSNSCDCFRPLKFDNETKKLWVTGHNGLRNRIANKFNIGNMNLVYWSDELAEMAKRFCYLCLVGSYHQNCLFLGTKMLAVTYTYFFQTRNLFKGWPTIMMRQWFEEDYRYIHNMQDYLIELEKGKSTNYTHLSWPLAEFIGCGGVKFNHGYLISCFYYPSVNVQAINESFDFGKTCSSCRTSRPTCSKKFEHLCGVDMTSSSMIKNPVGLTIGLLITMLFSALPNNWGSW